MSLVRCSRWEPALLPPLHRHRFRCCRPCLQYGWSGSPADLDIEQQEVFLEVRACSGAPSTSQPLASR